MEARRKPVRLLCGRKLDRGRARAKGARQVFDHVVVDAGIAFNNARASGSGQHSLSAQSCV